MRLVIVDQSFVDMAGHHAEYTLCIAREAAKYVDVTVLANNKCEVQSSAGIEIRPTFRLPWTRGQRARPPAVYDPAVSFPAWPFLADLRLGLAALGLTAEDHVFIHTIGFVEIEDLLTLAMTADRASLPVFDILLRRDLDELAEETLARQRFIAYLRAFPGLGLWPDKARFYTDTAELSEQYSEATGFPFATLAIPFDQEAMQAALAARPPRTAAEPLIVGYLGDARPEKGYQLLPTLAARLMQSHLLSGKVRLRLQSNYNLPGGETPAIPEARRALERFGPAAVELLYDPLDGEDYYRQLAEMDVIVLPYQADRYPRRSSGIFVQAAAAGKVVVVPRGTTMAAEAGRFGMPNCIVYDTPSDLPAAVTQAIERGADIAAEDLGYLDGWRAQNSPAALVAALLDPAGGADDAAAHRRAAPLVLHVIDGHSTFNRTGAAAVQEAQSRFLRAAGYRVATAFLVRTYPSDEHAPLWVERNYRYWFASECAFSWLVYFTHPPDEQGPRSLETDLADSEMLSVPETLRGVIASGGVDVVWTNYITTFPYLDCLGVSRSVPVVCESHDIQSFQYAIQGRRAVDDAELAVELELLARCDAVVSLSASETLLMAGALGPGRVDTITPPMFDEPLSFDDIAGAQDLGELVSSAESQLSFVDFSKAQGRGETWQFDLLRAAASLDLLFVSSVHPPNMQSFDWFLDNVYGPRLASRGVTLLLAGSLGETEWARERQRRFPNTFFVSGRVDNLRPLYAAAKIVILPITQGAGVNIKSVEALSLGKPVVATSLALRGLSTADELPQAFDAADSFAARVLELLGDASLRRQEAHRNYQLAAGQRDVAAYFDALSEVFGRLVGERPEAVQEPSSERVWEFVEWDRDIQMVNRLARALIEGLGFLRELVQHVGPILRKPGMRDRLQQILSTLVYRREAPLFKTQAYVLTDCVTPRVGEEPRSELAAIRSVYCHAAFPRAFVRPSPGLLAGCRTLGEVVRCAGAAAGSELLDSFVTIDIAILAQDTDGASPRVFVDGVMKFIEECYVPHLASQGVTIAIIGNLEIDVRLPGVVVLPRIGNPAPILAAARIVVAPWSELAVLHPSAFDAAIQAITACRPLVATDEAMWFLDQSERADFTVALGEASAARITSLLSAATERLAAAAATRELADRLLAELPAWQDWKTSAEGAGQFLMLGDARFAEWGPWAAASGNLIQKVARRIALTAAEVAGFVDDLDDPACREAWSELVDAVFGRRDALSLRAESGPVLALPADAAQQIGGLDDFIFAVKKSAFEIVQRGLQLGRRDDPFDGLAMARLQASGRAGVPVDPRAILLGDGAAAIELDLAAPIPGFGWYAAEQRGGDSHRWTGPEPRFTLELFLAPSPYECSMELIPIRRDQLESFVVECNGVALPHRVREFGQKVGIDFEVPARDTGDRPHLAILAFKHDGVVRPADEGAGDKRQLGFAVFSIRFARNGGGPAEAERRRALPADGADLALGGKAPPRGRHRRRTAPPEGASEALEPVVENGADSAAPPAADSEAPEPMVENGAGSAGADESAPSPGRRNRATVPAAKARAARPAPARASKRRQPRADHPAPDLD